MTIKKQNATVEGGVPSTELAGGVGGKNEINYSADHTSKSIRRATSAAATMSSREIAELVESRHDSVKRTMETLAGKALISFSQSVETSHEGAGARPVDVYIVGKRDSYIIVAQLSPEFTARLVDRWQELEAAAAPVITLPDFANPAAAARAWADEVEAKQALQLELAAAAPAVEFVERYVDSAGTKGFRQVCKLLGANENVFRTFLIEKKIMYRLGNEWTPFAQHLDAGRFVVKAGTSESSGHAFNSAKFTARGVQWVAGEFARYQLKGRL
jgi:phage antirepressor YoqD-like protein